MVRLVGHREPKGAETEMPHLSPPRQSSTLPVTATAPRRPNGRTQSVADVQAWALDGQLVGRSRSVEASCDLTLGQIGSAIPKGLCHHPPTGALLVRLACATFARLC